MLFLPSKIVFKAQGLKPWAIFFGPFGPTSLTVLPALFRVRPGLSDDSLHDLLFGRPREHIHTDADLSAPSIE
jgi:hypothetical protein